MRYSGTKKRMNQIVYKVVPKLTWNRFICSTSYCFYGDEYDLRSGFIHLSTKQQVPSVVLRKYPNMYNHYILTVDLIKCSTVKWEIKNDELYPHVYGYLELFRDIIDIEPLEEFLK